MPTNPTLDTEFLPQLVMEIAHQGKEKMARSQSPEGIWIVLLEGMWKIQYLIEKLFIV